MTRTLLAALLLLGACATARAEPSGCPPAGYDQSRLEALKTAEWEIADPSERDRFARALTACLAAPDPHLRDGIAFEALQHMMRARQLSPATMMALQDDLEARLTAPEGAGFERPFAALVLAEVARADRVEPYLTPARRERLIVAGTGFLRGVRDYRGFDQQEGWRHGVAHGADLMLQLSLNPALGRPELERIRDAVAAQVAPDSHAYVFGEGERLAAPILYIARRGVFTDDEWSAWLAQVAAPAPYPSWDGTFSSEAMLRKRHNATAFFSALYLNARLSENSEDDALLPGAEAALRSLP